MHTKCVTQLDSSNTGAGRVQKPPWRRHAHVIVIGELSTREWSAPRRPRRLPKLFQVIASRNANLSQRSSRASMRPMPISDERPHGGADTIYRSFDRCAAAHDESNEPSVSAGPHIV